MLTKTLTRSSTGDRPLCRGSRTDAGGSCGRTSTAIAGGDGSTTLVLVFTAAGAERNGISGRRARATRASSGSTRTSSGLIGSSSCTPGIEAAMADDFAIHTVVPVQARDPTCLRGHIHRSSRADCRVPIAPTCGAERLMKTRAGRSSRAKANGSSSFGRAWASAYAGPCSTPISYRSS
jgi:hypothetical protein